MSTGVHFRRPEGMIGYHFYGCPAWRGEVCCCKSAVDTFLESKCIPLLGAIVETKVVTTITKRAPDPQKRNPKREKREKVKAKEAAKPPILTVHVIGGPGSLKKRYISEGHRIRWDVAHHEKKLNSKDKRNLVVIMINNCSHPLRDAATVTFAGTEFVYSPTHGVSELVALLERYRQAL